MRRKIIFIITVTIIMLFWLNMTAFAAVEIELPDKLKAFWEALKTISPFRPDNITMNLYGHEMTIIDFSYVERHLDTIHWIIRALVYPFLLFFNYDRICSILRGTPFSAGSFASYNNRLESKNSK